MVSNEEIMDMLKLILGKVEKLESVKAENVTISSGNITIQTGVASPISIGEVNEITIKAVGNAAAVSINSEGDIDNISVAAETAPSVSIECNGDITGDITAKEGKADIQSESLKLQRESEHFSFYCVDKDNQCLDDISKVLEENFSRITRDINAALSGKVVVKIYPDISSFHKAMNNPNAPDWLVGTAKNGQIQMVSPKNPGKSHNYDSILKVAVHEFTHIVVQNINKKTKDIPIWLNEGLAQYETKQMDRNRRKEVTKIVSSNKIPKFDELQSDKFSDLGGYSLCYTIIELLVKKFGYNKLVELIKNPSNWEGVIGISANDFEKLWNEYLSIEYKTEL